MKKTLLLVSMAAALLLWAALPHLSAEPPESRFNAKYFTNAEVLTHDGRKVRFYDDLIRDKIVFIDFIYTNCTDICPLTTARVARVAEQLGERLGKDFFLISISLDPERDTPEMLKMFAEGYQAPPGWTFITGHPGDLQLIRHRLGEKSRKLSEHIAHAVIGNDRTGEWTRTSVMTDINLLVDQILRMDPEFEKSAVAAKPHQGEKPEHTFYRLSKLPPGQVLFQRTCAVCHTIGNGDLVGPDLHGVLERRDRAWLERFMLAPDKMIAEGDPIAVELADRYPGSRMPNLGLKKADIEDLLSYIALRSEKASGNDQDATDVEAKDGRESRAAVDIGGNPQKP